MVRPLRTIVGAMAMALLCCGFSAAQTAGPKIDVHLHPFPAASADGARPLGYTRLNDRLDRESPPPLYATDGSVLIGTLKHMEKNNIVLGMVSAGANQPMWREKAGGSSFLWGGHFNVRRMEPPVDTLKSRVARDELHFMGEFGPQYGSRQVDDTLFDPYFAATEELDIPVLVHLGGLGARFESFRYAMGRPLYLENVLKKHPKLRVQVENAGYPFADEMLAPLYMYPSVYADLSTITWLVPREEFHSYLLRFIQAGFEDRLMFGSDQMSWPETIDLAVEAVDSAEFLTDQQKRDIFFNNAVRFYRLDPEKLNGTR